MTKTYLPMPKMTDEYRNRFWSKVKIGQPDECWLWQAARAGGRYGVIMIAQVQYHAHRLAYFIHTQSDPGELFVLHTCDNPPCVNPSHLFLGTNDDNMADMVAKGRQAKGDSHGWRTHPESIVRGERMRDAVMPSRLRGDDHPFRKHPELVKRGDEHPFRKNPQLAARGEKNGNTKYSNDTVLEIRRLAALGVSNPEIAERFKISLASIWRIKKRINRKDI